MGKVYLLQVETVDEYCDRILTDTLFAGVNCEEIFKKIVSLLEKKRPTLVGEEIIKVIEEKYKISNEAKEYLTRVFPSPEDGDGAYLERIYVSDIPIEIFGLASNMRECQDIIPAVKIVNKEEGDFYIVEGDNILLSDKQGRICGGVLEGLDICHEDKKTGERYNIVLMGVLDEIIEIDSREIKSMQKLNTEII